MGTKVSKKKRSTRRNTVNTRKRVDISAEAIDYKNPELLKKHATEKGKILPRRITGLPAKLHRRMNCEIKRARAALLLK